MRAKNTHGNLKPRSRSNSVFPSRIWRFNIPIEVEAIIEWPQGTPRFFNGVTMDISIDGAKVLLSELIPSGTQNKLIEPETPIRLIFRQGAILLELSGVVAWRENNKEGGDKTISIGVKFESIPLKLKNSLIPFIIGFESGHQQK